MLRRLNAKEEQVMCALWSLKNAFVKDIIDTFPSPKPHVNTISSIVRKLESEGFIGHRSYGRSHKYYAVASKKAYRAALFEHLYSEYFNSKKKFLSYTIEKLELTQKDLAKIKPFVSPGGY